MAVAGIDIGSLTTEMVVLSEGKVLSSVMLSTGSNSRTTARKALTVALEESGLSQQDLEYIVATGYGRVSADFATRQVTEITCHGKGAFFLAPEVRTVIDIGGQDSKVICLGRRGKVTDFVMNDKCAAGTGRFLEVMAGALEVDLEEFSRLAISAGKPVSISSMCAVFAESEVISLIAEGYPRQEIMRGIVSSITERTITMVNRMGVDGAFMMTGGVARNKAVVEGLQKGLAVKIKVPEDPQMVGALGAALIAGEEVSIAGSEHI